MQVSKPMSPESPEQEGDRSLRPRDGPQTRNSRVTSSLSHPWKPHLHCGLTEDRLPASPPSPLPPPCRSVRSPHCACSGRSPSPAGQWCGASGPSRSERLWILMLHLLQAPCWRPPSLKSLGKQVRDRVDLTGTVRGLQSARPTAQRAHRQVPEEDARGPSVTGAATPPAGRPPAASPQFPRPDHGHHSVQAARVPRTPG